MNASNERVKHGSDLRATFTGAAAPKEAGRRPPRNAAGPEGGRAAPPRDPTNSLRTSTTTQAPHARFSGPPSTMTDVNHRRSDMATQGGSRPLEPSFDAAVAELAERQHGVVAYRQLVALGLAPGAVKHRAGVGRWHGIYRGVYAVGHRRLTPNGHRMAALLACGPRSVLSHRDAAALWGLRPTARTRTDVTVPRPAARSRPGI